MAGARDAIYLLLSFALHGESSALHKIAKQQQCRCIVISIVQTAQICSVTVLSLTCVPSAAIAASSAAATPTTAAAAAAANAAAEEAKGWFTGAAAHKREKRVIAIVGTAGKICK
jgi:hypothetical protein